jgi:hypothetical protein
MASLVLNDAYVLINAVDLSDYVQSATVNYSAEMVDETAMGDTSRKNKGGLKNWSIDVEFKQNFAAGAVDATLFSLVGTTFPVEVRPTSAARSATNPAYTGTGVLESYNPIGNSVGDLATAAITIQSAGTLTRLTA